MEPQLLHPNATFEHVGYIPMMLANSGIPAKEQLHAGYAHGGGWQPFEGFTYNKDNMTLEYPSDPPTHAIARWHLSASDEEVILFEHAWVMVRNLTSHEYEIARMD